MIPKLSQITLAVATLVGLASVFAVPLRAESPAERGYRFLTEKAYLPPDFDQETFDNVYRVWPEPLRTKAANATLAVRRKMAFERYGLSARPGDDQLRPLQYVVENGKWSMNCFACHGGTVQGETYPGAPNTQYALEMLTADIRATKLKISKPMSHMDVGSLFMPLGTTRGTTNAVMFGVALLAYRDADLNVLPKRLPPRMVHHDMDAPPWWHFAKKKNLYIDGFAPKGRRPLMQFMLVEQNGPEEFKSWQTDFEDVFAYISSLQPPKYPGKVDHDLAATGKAAFEANCAECHGSYGEESHYPERMIPIEEIGTDEVRWKALSVPHRQRYADSWFHEGEEKVETAPEGYIAPPLDGVWASAPYLHNGSVPTLWHLLNPDKRPQVWTRRSRELDHERMGLSVVELENVPAAARSSAERREYFDTRFFGKKAVGHTYPQVLTADEKRAVLEYLKTL